MEIQVWHRCGILFLFLCGDETVWSLVWTKQSQCGQGYWQIEHWGGSWPAGPVSVHCLLIITRRVTSKRWVFSSGALASVLCKTYYIYCNFSVNTCQLRRAIFFSPCPDYYLWCCSEERVKFDLKTENDSLFGFTKYSKNSAQNRERQRILLYHRPRCAASPTEPAPEHVRLCTHGSNLHHLIKTHWIKGQVIIYSAGLTNATFFL